MNSRVIVNAVMVLVWIGVWVYCYVRYPVFRDPFGGDNRISMFWLLFTIMTAWNIGRVVWAWKPREDKPPVRRDPEEFRDPTDVNF